MDWARGGGQNSENRLLSSDKCLGTGFGRFPEVGADAFFGLYWRRIWTAKWCSPVVTSLQWRCPILDATTSFSSPSPSLLRVSGSYMGHKHKRLGFILVTLHWERASYPLCSSLLMTLSYRTPR